MLYGRIKDFYVASTGDKKSVVKFLIKNDDVEQYNSHTVCAEIPNDALQFKMIKAGSSIGWEFMKVFIDIEGVEDMPFRKVGTLRGDEVTFYEHLKILTDLKQDKI